MDQDILGIYPSSEIDPMLPRSFDDDPFSGENIAIAEAVLRRTDGLTDIDPYPVPDWLNEFADVFAGRPYYEVEQACRLTFMQRFNTDLPLPALRSWVICELKETSDPIEAAHRMSGVRNLPAYLKTIVVRRGRPFHSQPTTPRPVTIIQRPWVAEIPEWDACAEDANLLRICTMLERMGVPRMFRQRVAQFPSSRTIEDLRAIKSKKRQKSLEDKKIKWSR
jgi:hypothetical protein